MYQFLLNIERHHVRVLSEAIRVQNKFISELSGNIRNPPPINAQATVQQRNLYLQQLLNDFTRYKNDFVIELQAEWNRDFVNDDAREASLRDLMNRYEAELIRIYAALNTL